MDVAVTQITSLTTGVTANGINGVITTFNATLAAAATAKFTVTCTGVNPNNGVIATIMDYSGAFGTNGTPIVTIDNIVEDAFDVILANNHATLALNGVLKIAFLVI